MAITRTQIARQLLQFGGGADMGAERGPETGREAGPVGGGPGVTGEGPRGDGPATGAPSLGLIDEIRREQLEKAPDVVRESKFDFLDFVPGIGLVRKLADILPSGGKPFPTPIGDGGSEVSPRITNIPLYLQKGFNTEEEYLKSLEDEEEDPKGLEALRLAFRADGGPIGGEYDFEPARQMYGLGKLVKKVTRSVKKIAKSPIGKAAIAAAGVYYLGGGAIGPFQRTGLSTPGFSFGNLPGASLFTKKSPVKLAASVADRQVFNAARTAAGSGIPAISGKAALGILGASALAGLLTPEQEDEAQALADNTGIDIDEARQSILRAGTRDDFRARAFRAEGGSMKEPVAKKTMPLLDLDGKEMDLRAEGGFVPIGRMEKADDVPARLSKNEFVFTADAVRNAGDGNVDKGAEVMYNMMKNLEAGGDVSEESQGLEGARRMFQTSKRLEEVL